MFVEGVRRRIEVEQARDIIAEVRRERGDDCPRIVGLFANQRLADVNGVARACGLDAAQLCGDEPPEYWDGVDAGVIRQVKVDDGLPRDTAVSDALREVELVAARGHMTLLDKRVRGALGGTGHTFDWGIAAEIARRHPIFLAGGLDAGNVARAIAAVAPRGVDVSSGVETGGVKDAGKIAAFGAAVRGADVSAGN